MLITFKDIDIVPLYGQGLKKFFTHNLKPPGVEKKGG